ncbi:MAG: hypothetical protein K1X28_10145 [Parachlamydiales bacterium]|nr:hypothetical protein [Parachlamydiales bacterium]
MSIEAVSNVGYETYQFDDDSFNWYLRKHCSSVVKAFSSQKAWLSNQDKPLCHNNHFAKYAVIDRTKDVNDPQKIVCFLCEYHGCPFEARNYQAKALLPNQFILAIEYLKNKAKKV